MTLSSEISPKVAPLDSEDSRLVDAYLTVGRAVEDLPYSEELDHIRKLLRLDDSDYSRRALSPATPTEPVRTIAELSVPEKSREPDSDADETRHVCPSFGNRGN